jgi:hypothetical protein
LFPGFFDERVVHSSELKAGTARLVDEVFGSLEEEITKSLEYSPPPELQSPKRDLRPIARTYTLEFLESLPRIRDLLKRILKQPSTATRRFEQGKSDRGLSIH